MAFLHYKKIMHLLETQSIALRHRACAIQIKQKRKSSIEQPLFEKLTSSLAFNGDLNTEYLNNFVNKILPNNTVVVALVLNNMSDLYIVRLERGSEPFFYKLEYNTKYNEDFKQIMLENDLSMKQSDRTKYWSTRTDLNNRLNSYLKEFEANVFSYARALLLGSYVDYDFKLFKKNLEIVSLNETQESLLKIILLGLQIFTAEELCILLKKEFAENEVDKYMLYLRGLKDGLTAAKRKHVCLLIDKVNFFGQIWG